MDVERLNQLYQLLESTNKRKEQRNALQDEWFNEWAKMELAKMADIACSELEEYRNQIREEEKKKEEKREAAKKWYFEREVEQLEPLCPDKYRVKKIPNIDTYILIPSSDGKPIRQICYDKNKLLFAKWPDGFKWKDSTVLQLFLPGARVPYTSISIGTQRYCALAAALLKEGIDIEETRPK